MSTEPFSLSQFCHQYHNLADASLATTSTTTSSVNKSPFSYSNCIRLASNSYEHNSNSNMTMKHPRDNENLLLGSDHSKQKRPRTGSDLSESSSIENKSSQCNTNQQQQHDISKPNTTTNQTSTTTTSHSPRMMALLSSLEVLDDSEAQKLQHKWPRVSSPSPSPPATGATAEAAAAFLQQKNYAQPQRKFQQPLIARPRVHKITERSPMDESNNTNSAASTAAPSPETVPNTTKTVLAVAPACQYQNYQQLAPQLAIVAAPRTTTSTTTVPIIAPKPVVLSGTANPLDAFLFPLRTLSNKNTINNTHTNFPVTVRQIAIHNAVHSDYKKTYKPLQRPPRLPTPHEALVIAAISTARTAPSCR